VFGYPKESAAHVALKTTREWLEEGDNQAHMDLVVFNVFLEEDNQIYNKLAPVYFSTHFHSFY
jgi:O-acetyl-ADP-ribose deacetylase